MFVTNSRLLETSAYRNSELDSQEQSDSDESVQAVAEDVGG